MGYSLCRRLGTRLALNDGFDTYLTDSCTFCVFVRFPPAELRQDTLATFANSSMFGLGGTKATGTHTVAPVLILRQYNSVSFGRRLHSFAGSRSGR